MAHIRLHTLCLCQNPDDLDSHAHRKAANIILASKSFGFLLIMNEYQMSIQSLITPSTEYNYPSTLLGHIEQNLNSFTTYLCIPVSVSVSVINLWSDKRYFAIITRCWNFFISNPTYVLLGCLLF